MVDSSLGDLNFSSLCDCSSKQSGNILDSVSFVRLSAFQECRKSPVLSGEISCCGQVFRRFRWKNNREVALDFWHRGFSVSDNLANEFFKLVSSPGPIQSERLIPIAEVLGPIAAAVRCQMESDIASMIPIKIDASEVRTINSKNVLFVFWSDTNQNRTHVSLFVDSKCDGLKVDEIHFSMPSELVEETSSLIAETLDSIQWNILAPPPIPGLEAVQAHPVNFVPSF